MGWSTSRVTEGELPPPPGAQAPAPEDDCCRRQEWTVPCISLRPRLK